MQIILTFTRHLDVKLFPRQGTWPIQFLTIVKPLSYNRDETAMFSL